MTISNDFSIQFGEPLASEPDVVFDAVILPDTTTVESDVISFGQLQSGVRFALSASGAVTTVGTVTVEVLWGTEPDDTGWAATDKKTIGTIAAAESFADGDVLVHYTSDFDVDHYVKFAITSTGTETGTVNGKLHYISR